MDGNALAKSYEYTANIIRQQASEIDHAESLVQPVADGHSINWLLGHILSARSFPLQFVGACPVWSDEARARYRNGSDAIGADGPGVLQFDELMQLFDLSQRRLLPGLRAMSEAALSAAAGYGDNSVYESLLYFHFHETYHVGQMTMIAEARGRNAKYVEL